MRYKIWFNAILLFFICCEFEAFAQSDSLRMKKDLTFLASDKLKGRLTGSKYEKKAANYIANSFKTAGLVAKGENNTYFQDFSFNSGYKYGNNELEIESIEFIFKKDFWTFPTSPNIEIKGVITDVGYGISEPKQLYDDYANIEKNGIKNPILIINLGSPDDASPRDHNRNFEKFDGYLSRLEIARKHNPTAVIFFGGEKFLDEEYFKRFNNLQKEAFPIIYVKDSIIKLIRKDGDMNGKKVELETSVSSKKINGRNVIGFIDNKAKLTVVIGAHFDHLGYGEFGNSLYRGKKAIHNGADDNASGTSMIMEMARVLKNKKSNYNYLITAFSGEEIGLLGSNYFSKHLTIPKNEISYMINLDMVGRLQYPKKELAVSGTGTSPTWDTALKLITNGRSIYIKSSPAGMGPSDHSSFYLQSIPALHFYTGAHQQYHKPDDDVEKINFPGMSDISDYLLNLIEKTENHPKFIFTTTKEDSSSPKVSFKVTLGVIPDYFYDKKGLRIEGVTDGKPAQKSGLKGGDIILQVGDLTIGDINDYMRALTKFNKGDHTQIKLDRNGNILTLPLTFE